MLELNSVRFSYDHQPYEFNLTAQAQSTTAIMGKSGSGKSTCGHEWHGVSTR